MADMGENGREAAVLEAVQEFVTQHGEGRALELDTFCSRYPADLRADIHKQCMAFLDFDGLVGRQTEEAPEEEAAPRGLGDFVLEEELGRGGMGIVYLASQISAGRKVAVKILPPGLSLSTRHVERFRREAAAAARLDHPAIVPIRDVGEVDGTHFFSMEYVAGRDLARIVEDLRREQPGGARAVRGSLNGDTGTSYAAQVALLCAEIASALSCAHQAGIVHRDLKPRNVIVDEGGGPHLLDFGLAKDIADTGEVSLSLTGELAGTPHYMSPEQTLAKRVRVDHRTDIFSLGVMLYELLTLQRPFDGRDLQQIVYKICFSEPTPINRLNTQVPADLITICTVALEKVPTQRYASAAEMEADLRRFLRHEPIHARPPGLIARAGKWVRGHRAVALGAASALVLGLGYSGWDWYDDHRSRVRSNELMASAEDAQHAGNHEQALRYASDAVRVRPEDDDVELRMREIQLRQVASERDLKETNRLFLESGNVLDQDPDLALILALRGAEITPGPMAQRAVLAALEPRYRNVTLRGHDSQINKVAISFDGRYLLTGSTDNTARLWDSETGSEVHVLEGHGLWVMDARFSVDGMKAITASVDGSARVWNLETGAPVSVMRGHRMQLVTAAFSPDGLLAVTTSMDQTAMVWNVATGERIATLEGHQHFMETAEFSPDGRMVATASGDRTARLWDARTGTELGMLGSETAHGGWVEDVCFSPDGSLVATACRDSAARIFATDDGRLLWTLRHSDVVNTVRFSPDGARLVTASDDRTARLWDVGSGIELQALLGHGDHVNNADFSSDGAQVVTSSDDQAARVFDAEDGRELARLHCGFPVYEAVFDPAGARVVTRAGSRSIRVWELTEGRQIIPLRDDHGISLVRFDRAGTRALTCSVDVRIWSALDGGLLLTITEEDQEFYCADFDPSGDRVVIAADPHVYVRSTRTGENLLTLQGHRSRVETAFFSADGTRIVTAGRDNTARIWDSQTGVELAGFERPKRVIFAELSPDGRRLLTVERQDAVARIWDVETRALRQELHGHEGFLTSAVFHPEEDVVLTASLDRTARLWNASSGEVMQVFSGHEQTVGSAQFNRDGTRVITGSDDRSARIWNAATGELELVFDGHVESVEWAALSPDGTRAISGSIDHTARIWPTDPLARAHQLELRSLTLQERERFDLLRPIDVQARELVEGMFDEWFLATHVIEELRSGDLDPELRELAVRIAEQRGSPDVFFLSNRALRQVGIAEPDPLSAQRTVNLTRALVRSQPENPEHVAMLGAALYRAGQFEDALVELERAAQLRDPRPLELAFLAMTRYRLGQLDAARAELEELRIGVSAASPDGISRSLLEEAIAMIDA